MKQSNNETIKHNLRIMESRLSKVKQKITKKHLEAVLISSVPNITYLTSFSHFSKVEREAFLFITANKQYILTDGRYSEAVKNHIPDFELIEISSNLSFEKALKNLAKKHNIKRLGIDHHDITVAEHKKLSQLLNDLNHFTLDNLRMIKSSSEVLAIEKACELGDKTFKHILGKIKKGITEKQLAFEIEFFIKKKGADISFPPIVAFGKNSAIPHHKANYTKLGPSTSSGQKGQFVLFDFGVKLGNYCSDMTRTVFFGKASREQKRIYQTVLDAQKKAMGTLTSDGGPERSRRNSSEVESIKAKRIDKVARDYIVSKKYKTIPHGLGHGIGLEVHESPKISPKSKDVLMPGMVFTIEPGIYIEGYGGVRIEDVVLLKENHPRLLTESTRDLIIL